MSDTLVGQRYYVNAGVYSAADNAAKAQQKLQRAGLPVVVQQVTTNRGERSRVRAGPFATAAEAKTVAQRIRSLGLEAVVYHHR